MNKNIFQIENCPEKAFFCHLQVSERFRRTIDCREMELCEWIVTHLCHRTATQEQVWQAHDELLHRLEAINNARRPEEPFLLLTFAPLRPLENGFLRIERSSGRHQSLLLPIIDCRGQADVAEEP